MFKLGRNVVFTADSPEEGFSLRLAQTDDGGTQSEAGRGVLRFRPGPGPACPHTTRRSHFRTLPLLSLLIREVVYFHHKDPLYSKIPASGVQLVSGPTVSEQTVPR